MADNNNDSGFLYFMVGVLVIGMMGLGYFYYNGTPMHTSSNNTTVIEKTTTEHVPSIPDTDKSSKPAGGY